MSHDAIAGVKRITVEAIVIRADGTVEDLGVIDETTYDTPQPAPPGLLRALKQAWVEGWDAGTKKGRTEWRHS